MTAKFNCSGFVFAVLAFSFAIAAPAYAQTFAPVPARPMITVPVSNANSVPLPGNTHPEANAANDRGFVADNLPMEHMLLQLRRPPERERALTQLIDQLHDPASPNFHKWLTLAQFGAQFGPAASDVAQVTGWLRSRGLRVDATYPSGMVVDFSGTAGQVRTAFRTEIHHLVVGGESHFANMSDPQIPAALAPAVVGIAALHDFQPQPKFSGGNNCFAFQVTKSCHQVMPADLATIYNFNPVFSAGNTGQDQTIYLIENGNVFNAGDWTTFRSIFGLLGYTGASFTTIHPKSPSGLACTDPGVNGSEGEAILDAEWATAAAPNAALVMASCANLLTALQNVINDANPPAIISVSYGFCETGLGAAANASYNSIYQQGVAEGISIFVAAGDEGAASCDSGAAHATHGITISGLASTPYNVAVGGTDFGDTFAGTTSTYWNSNTPAFGSAKSYVPEIPWNSTCASQLVATFEGFANTYGSTGFCNSTKGRKITTPSAGSGGPSGCATGAPSIKFVVSGTCAGYAKPSWQTGVVGIPADGVRDIPDVSLFAAQGPWGHTFGYCDTIHEQVCTVSGIPAQYGFGTSASTPIMAGVQALINQQTGQRQGNPNVRYYQLAASQYGPNGNSTCDATKGNAVGGSCIFHDVTQGGIDTACGGTQNCFFAGSGIVGVLTTTPGAYAPAYPATTGWDFATGIGTVNVANLVMNWTGLSLTATPNAGPAPLAVTFQALLMSGDQNTYSVDFGDATSGQMSVGPSGIACVASGPCYSEMATVSHTYASAATYTARLLNSSSTSVATAAIVVSASPSPARPSFVRHWISE